MRADVPNRILRDGILASDRVDRLTPEAEVFYRRLMSVVDDYGRFEARPIRLRSACYPLRVDVVLDAQVAAYLNECESAILIVRYEVSGKAYLQLLDFKQHVRAKASKYPDPPTASPTEMRSNGSAHATHMNGTRSANARLDVDVDVDVVEDVCVNARARESRPKRSKSTPTLTPLPPGFAVSPRVRKWADERGYKRMAERLEHFAGRAKAKDYRYADWDEAFMEAVRRDWAGLDAKGGKAVSMGEEL